MKNFDESRLTNKEKKAAKDWLKAVRKVQNGTSVRELDVSSLFLVSSMPGILI